MKLLKEPMVWIMAAIVLVTVVAIVLNAWVEHNHCEALGGSLTRATESAREVARCHGPPWIR
jgi:hypothetical protein